MLATLLLIFLKIRLKILCALTFCEFRGSANLCKNEVLAKVSCFTVYCVQGQYDLPYDLSFEC